MTALTRPGQRWPLCHTHPVTAAVCEADILYKLAMHLATCQNPREKDLLEFFFKYSERKRVV